MVLWPGLLRRGVLALARPHILTPKLLSFMSMDGGGPGMGSLQKEPSSATSLPPHCHKAVEVTPQRDGKTNAPLGGGGGEGGSCQVKGPALRKEATLRDTKGRTGWERTQSRRKKGMGAASYEAGTGAPKGPAAPGVPRGHKAPLLWKPRRTQAMPGDPAAPRSPRGGRTCPYPSRARARPRNSPPWPVPATGELIVVGPRTGGSAQGGRGIRTHARTPA